MEIKTQFIKLTRAAIETGIPKTTFEEAIKNNELDVYRFRDKDRYLKTSQLNKWIESKKVMPIPLLRSKYYLNENE